MKITILSEIDYAGSGHKLYEALKPFCDVEIFTGKYYNPYGHPDHSKWNRREVQKRIDESDIIHLKGDFKPKDGYLGFRIMHKPTVVTVSGSKFRKAYHGGYQTVHPWEFNKATVKTSFEPDLLYPEYSDKWIPHPIDSINVQREWKEADVPTLMHIPSKQDVKGTDFILEVLETIENKRLVNISIPENVSHKKSVELKKEATIYFDQFVVGFYGNAALEAMQFGVPVAAWISHEARRQANGALYICPVISPDKNDVTSWVKKIDEVLDSKMAELSFNTALWCDTIHSYEAVALNCLSIYDAI